MQNCIRGCMSGANVLLFLKSPKKNPDRTTTMVARRKDTTIGQFAIWPLQKNKTLMHIYSSLIRLGQQCQTALFSFSCCCASFVRERERELLYYYCHQSKYRSFLLDFCMHLSNEAQKSRELKAYEKNSRKLCFFVATEKTMGLLCTLFSI